MARAADEAYLEKFKADIKKARSAKSPLLAAVQNFYNSKERQQIYDGIELALQTVQLAGAITSSVPEPMTMAVGRAITASAGLARGATDLGHMLHDEKLLRSGWKKTLDAINNPANRRAGLDALHNNGTLAAHAVAWAAKDGDRMAREILNSCGVNEQTLADNQSDQEAVVAYLETRLYEDLQFKDDEKVKIGWVPTPVVLRP